MKTKGFTLIETLVAMVLLAGALIVLGNAWSGSLGAIRKSRALTTLSLLLQKKITEYEIKFQDKTAGEVPDEEEGDFGDDFTSYRWKMQSRKMTLPDLAAALTAREGGATEMELMVTKQLTDIIEKSVREVKVSVFWKILEKEQEYSVTTYFVDHDKVTLMGMGGGAPAADPTPPPAGGP